MKLTSQIWSATSLMPTVLATEHGADVDFTSAKADAAAASHPCGSIMIRVFELGRWLVRAG